MLPGLASVRRERSDIDQPDNLIVTASFCDYGAAVRMSDQKDWPRGAGQDY